MNIQNNNVSSLKFTSRLNPISSHIVKTSHGKLILREATNSELKNSNFVENVSKLFCSNFASNTNDPAWKMYNLGSKKIRSQILENFKNFLKDIFKNDDGNMTLLFAKDKRNKIQGACLSYGYNLVDGSEKYTLYVDSIAVNKMFRGGGLGRKMLQKTIDANKKNSTFTDIFLTGEKTAAEFYKKNGFSSLNPLDKNQNKVIKLIAEDRMDYPNYIQLLSKPLKPEQPRWYDRVAKIIPDDLFLDSTL